jgi:hypothetical protein
VQEAEANPRLRGLTTVDQPAAAWEYLLERGEFESRQETPQQPSEPVIINLTLDGRPFPPLVPTGGNEDDNEDEDDE